MSGKLWDSKRLMKVTTVEGMKAAMWAYSKGLDFHGVCMFIGYYIERLRQSGRGDVTLFKFWDSCVRSGHKYSKGAYGPLYLKAGMLLMSEYARHHSDSRWPADVPANLVWDRIIEESLVPVPNREDRFILKFKSKKGDFYVKTVGPSYFQEYKQAKTKEQAARFTKKQAKSVREEFISETGEKGIIEEIE